MHTTELDFILRSFNSYKAKDVIKRDNCVSEHYKYISILFSFETILVDKASLIFFTSELLG
ncbi:hypothetical protein NBO_24g0027 [Nosema bombycis CQ1]|uniref:Uncharacterized protein n=1 Tax=Nosema bombycis (strain CQ1 / CVCC 102059) TaxID=578461 RepID=R0KWI5_NOSB1|nr:hypothetical protein NBO_24g0027 [Nosema bombycis CQ1]|eukprot:EOB14582.1 hypothetical protein NBO_24g0027 [Nosema bombycis CQ1]